MTQLAASRSAPASSSFGNVADISPVLALGRSLILVSAHIPYEVHEAHSGVIATSPALRTALQIVASIMIFSLWQVLWHIMQHFTRSESCR